MRDKYDIFKDDEYNCYQLRTKSDSFTIEFEDIEKENIFLEIIDHLDQKRNHSLDELKLKIQKGKNEAKVIEVLTVLQENQLLPFEIPYKKKNTGSANYSHDDTLNTKSIKDVRISVFGEGKLTSMLKKHAKLIGISNISVCSFNNGKAKILKAVDKSDFFIVDANRWAPYYIELINESALAKDKPWLYIGGIEDASIKIGPLFYGKETGCYNCLISRIKSNHEHPNFLTSYEEYLRRNKLSSKPDVIPNSDIVYNIIVNMALLEVAKFFENWSLPITWRSVISLNIFSFSSRKHDLLKKPFCEVCKPQLEYNPSPWLEAITLK